MYRGEIWVQGDADAYVLVGSDHLADNRSRPPIAWGVPLTAVAQPKKFTDPFVVALSPTQAGLTVATWVLVARGVHPLREASLTQRIGLVTDRALAKIDDSIRMLYDL